MQIFAFVCGIALRYAAKNWQNTIPWTVSYFVVHPTHLIDEIHFCNFLANRNISSTSRCSMTPAVYQIASFDHIEFVTIAVQLLTVFLFCRLPVPHETWGGNAAVIYWMSPLISMSAIMSPIPSSIHFLILLIAYSVHHRRTICALFLTSLLCSIEVDYYPMFVVVCYALISSTNPKHAKALYVLLGLHVALLSLYCMVGLWSVSPPGAFSRFTLAESTAVRGEAVVYPSFGVWWYLRAEVFSGYASYFSMLVTAQPLLYVLPLCMRLPNTSLIPVRVLKL